MENQDNHIQEEEKVNAESEKTTDIKTEISETEIKSESDNWEHKFNEMNDKYLRLYSEFDNYRKRTLKERAELIRTAGEEVLKSILPVLDDFERAIKANEKAEDIDSIKDGLKLIYNKLSSNTQQKGLMTFETLEKTFDADLMEAITFIPSDDENKKGKVIDEVEKGYKLGDKVIRFAKVVVAQ
jgi:molecular chaperone GrpE